MVKYSTQTRPVTWPCTIPYMTAPATHSPMIARNRIECPSPYTSQDIQRRPDVRGTHQRFTDQYGFHPGRFQYPQIRIRFDPAFANHRASRGHLRQEIECVTEPGLECSQVTIIDADQSGAAADHTGELFRVVQLHQDV